MELEVAVDGIWNTVDNQQARRLQQLEALMTDFTHMVLSKMGWDPVWTGVQGQDL